MRTEQERAYAREYAKRKLKERQDAGLCPRCGKRPPADNRKSCRQCLDRINARRRGWETVGLCNRCGSALAIPKRKTCKKCYNESHEAYLAAKENGSHHQIYRMQHGLCLMCGTPVDASDLFQGKPRRSCDECRTKHRLKKAKQRNSRFPEIIERDGGACQLCGSSHYLCVHHIDGVGLTHNGNPVSLAGRHNEPDNLITLCKHCHHALTQLRRQQNDRPLAIKLILAEPPIAQCE